MEKQAAVVAKFSERDADTMLKFAKTWDEWLYPGNLESGGLHAFSDLY